MSTIIRLAHPTGMKRITIHDSDTIFAVQKKIFDLVAIPPNEQKLSTTPLNNPTFIKTSPPERAFKHYNFENGKILYISPVEKNLGKEEKEFIEKSKSTRSKCQHGPNGKCLNCITTSSDVKNIKRKCLHGEGGACNNCTRPSTKEKDKPERFHCRHSSDSFCNNCIPSRNMTKKEEIVLRKNQNCFCTKPQQRCIHCEEARTSSLVDKHINSYYDFLQKIKAACHHQKSSFNPKTGFCGVCEPKKMVSFKLGNCGSHEPWPRGICAKCMPPNVNINLQPYRHCDEVSVIDIRPLSRFINGWLSEVETQRACLLIGTHETISDNSGQLTRAKIYAVHCSAFTLSATNPIFKGGEDFETIRKLVASCGLEIIGWAVTTLSRSDVKYGGELFLSCAEVIQAADFQIEFSDSLGHSRFVTMVVSHNERGEVEPKCYQVSDQCVAMRKAGLLKESDDHGFMTYARLSGGRYTPTIMYKNRDIQPGEKYLPDEFLVKVGAMKPLNPRPFFLHCLFPLWGAREEDLRTHLSATIEQPYHKKFSDFALLAFMRDKIGLPAVRTLASNVADAEEVNHQLGQILDGYLASYFVFQ